MNNALIIVAVTLGPLVILACLVFVRYRQKPVDGGVLVRIGPGGSKVFRDSSKKVLCLPGIHQTQVFLPHFHSVNFSLVADHHATTIKGLVLTADVQLDLMTAMDDTSVRRLLISSTSESSELDADKATVVQQKVIQFLSEYLGQRTLESVTDGFLLTDEIVLAELNSDIDVNGYVAQLIQLSNVAVYRPNEAEWELKFAENAEYFANKNEEESQSAHQDNLDCAMQNAKSESQDTIEGLTRETEIALAAIQKNANGLQFAAEAGTRELLGDLETIQTELDHELRSEVDELNRTTANEIAAEESQLSQSIEQLRSDSGNRIDSVRNQHDVRRQDAERTFEQDAISRAGEFFEVVQESKQQSEMAIQEHTEKLKQEDEQHMRNEEARLNSSLKEVESELQAEQAQLQSAQAELQKQQQELNRITEQHERDSSSTM